MSAGQKRKTMRIRDHFPLTFGSFLALAATFLTSVGVFVVGSSMVFYVAIQGFARLAERESPGSLEGPLTAAGPMLAAALATILFDIVILAILARLHVPLAKFFLVLTTVSSLSLIAVWYITVGSAQYFDGWYPLGFSVAQEYPVLVITPDRQSGALHAQVVQWFQLPDFCRQNPRYTFLVPEGEDSDLKQQMPKHDFQWALVPGHGLGEPVRSSFEVTRLSSSRQKLIVSGSWYRNSNASVRSWYEAEDRRIYPKYMNEGDTYGLYLRNALLLVGIVDLLGLAFYLRRVLKRNALHPPNSFHEKAG